MNKTCRCLGALAVSSSIRILSRYSTLTLTTDLYRVCYHGKTPILIRAPKEPKELHLSFVLFLLDKMCMQFLKSICCCHVISNQNWRFTLVTYTEL